MPVYVKHMGGGERPWKIVEHGTGKVVGSSEKKADADAAARIRNMKHFEKLKREGRIKKQRRF